jgi:hypothetical protein
MTAGPCGASAEPLVESRAHDPGVKLLGERLRLLQETEPHRRIHPNLKVGVRVEAHDRKPALLHTWYRRFESVTLKALCLRLGSGDLFLPGPIGGFGPRLEPRGYDGRDRRRQNAWRVVLQDMDIVLSYEQRQGMFDQIKPLFGIQPRRRRLEHLRARDVGEGGNAVVVQRRIHHLAGVVIDHVLGECPAETHRDRAVDLAATLHRVDEPADVGGVHAVQNAHLAGHAVHGAPDAVDVDRDRARRTGGIASGHVSNLQLVWRSERIHAHSIARNGRRNNNLAIYN